MLPIKSLHLTRVLTTTLIIIYLLLFLLVIINERWSDGDEVHYLLVSSSILKDGDLVLNNNYENKDYFAHHNHEESPHAYTGRHGELRPAHGILTSIIMTPAYGLSLLAKETLKFESNRAFLFFPRLTMLFIHILFSLILINFLRILGFSKNIRIFCVILYLIQLPTVIYSQAIYSDLIAGYFVMMGIYGVLIFKKRRNYKWLLLGSIFLGLTIFLHSKLMVLSLFLIINSFVYLHLALGKDDSLKIKDWFYSGYYRKIPCCILIPWISLLIANILMNFYWFGAFYFNGLGNPARAGGYLSLINRLLGRGWLGQWLDTKVSFILILIFTLIFFLLFILHKKKNSSFFLILSIIIPMTLFVVLAYPFRGWLGQWLDIEVGMIPNAPLLALIFTGLFIWFKKHRSSFLLIIPATLAYLFIKAGVSWYSGFSPSGRYLLISIPVLLPGLCWILWAARKIIWLRWIVGILTFFSLTLSALIPFVGRMGLPYSKSYNIYWRTILEFLRLDFLEPYISLNFLKPETHYYIIGTIIFILLFILGFYLQKKLSKIEKCQR
jgi:hypothetical protein